jgi:ferrochelatase
LGTPDDANVGAVRRYLFEFLNDPRVIDISAFARALLVNLIIVPFRAPKSTEEYKKLWTKEGSPLLLHGVELKEQVQNILGDSATVELAMRYQNPSLDSVLEKMKRQQYDKIIVLPLYPQYASSSTGSTLEKVMKIISKWWVIPEVSMISQFYDEPGYTDTFVDIAKNYDLQSYDHIVFSYHGLPVRQVDKVYEESEQCSDHDCENEIDEANRFCYKATCYATTRLMAEKLNLDKSQYTVAFQSRLDKKWLEPFSDKVVEQLGQEGKKKILFFSPAFTADCLETTVEIGEGYLELFQEHGGEELDLVPSLNTHPMWVNTVVKMIQDRM